MDEAREELEITRAHRETTALKREMEQERMQAEARAEAERVQQQNEQRLERLRAYGRSLAVALPIEWRQRVVSTLQGFVTATNVPTSLPDFEAMAFVAAKVDQVREEHEALRKQKLDEASDRSRVQGLVQGGRNAAAALTATWDPRDSAEAQADVARELKKCVEPDWTESDVRRRVEDILDDWEETAEEDGDHDEDEAQEDDEGEEEATW